MKRIIFTVFVPIIIIMMSLNGCSMREAPPENKRQQLSASTWQLESDHAKGSIVIKENNFTMRIYEDNSEPFVVNGTCWADDDFITIVSDDSDPVCMAYDAASGRLTLSYYDKVMSFVNVKQNTSQ